MSVRSSVFGSKSEERGFRSIEHTWGYDYEIYPQFPWSALFTPEPTWKGTSNLFFKTSVDYVFCEKGGRPLLAIDFDGMGGGHDRNGKYIQIEATRDKDRKAKFDFKLQYARDNGFPYYIVASEEFAHMGKDNGHLTVVDGIIGSTLAKQAFDERVQSYVEERKQALYALMESDPSTPDELKPVRSHIRFPDDSQFPQFMVTDLETECDLEFNPFYSGQAKILSQIEQIVGYMFPPHGFRWRVHKFQEPPLPEFDFAGFFRGDNVQLDALKGRMEGLKYVERWGCTVTLENTPVGEVSEIITIRNVAYSETLVGEIAEFMAYCKLLRLLRRKMESQ